MNEGPLERRLEALGASLEFPPSPDLVPGVRAALRPAPRRIRWRRLAPALAALMLTLAGVLVLSPGARDAVAGWLGLHNVRIHRGAPAPVPIGTDLQLGNPTTLADARARVGWHVYVPDIGEPHDVYYDEPPLGGRVSLVYAAGNDLPRAPQTGVGLLIGEFRISIGSFFVEKTAGTGTSLEEVSVGDDRGFWLSGAPHILLYRDANGNVLQASARKAGNVLLWEHNGVTIRMESALSKADAIRLALTFR
jgi:hypothetical protein